VSRLAADQTELLRALARHGVEFLVVGGVAAQVHGWRGATADLDIAVSTEDSNVSDSTSLWRAWAQATERLEPSELSLPRGTAGSRLSAAPMRSASTHWPRGARVHRLDEGLTVVVAAPEDIFRSKDAAGREKDRAALAQMRRDFRDSGAL
jgi:hypothetical protein